MSTLDLLLVRETKEPINLDPRGLLAHTVVLAQSGSGKSFMLGRLIEELATKTRAKVVILDPNSDFVRLSAVDESPYEVSALQEWLFPGESLDSFRKRWSEVSLDIASNRNLPGVRSLVLDWGAMSQEKMAAAMGINAEEEPDLYWTLFLTRQLSNDSWTDAEPNYDFDHFLDCSEVVTSYLVTGTGSTFLEDHPLAETLRSSSPHATSLRFSAIAARLVQYEIWRSRGDGTTDLTELVTRDEPAVLVIDLQSLETQQERDAVSMATLDALWDRHRDAQWRVLRDSDKPDTRVPTFLVIDEAHNLVPNRLPRPTGERLRGRLVQVAAEGRKYGLLLILATQRPRKLSTDALSECENLLLMKVSNDEDLALVRETFGITADDDLSVVGDYAVGDMLVRGKLDVGLEATHVAPRRTAQGGRSVSDSYWLGTGNEEE